MNENQDSTQDLLRNISNGSNFASFLPNLPNTLPQDNFEFIPPPPQRRFPVPNLNSRGLSRRIYLEMLRAIKDYGDLEILAPEQDKQTISSLKSQMEVLSLAMLNVYQSLNGRPAIPFFMNHRVPLPRDYPRALVEMYSRVYHIHNLTLRLFNQVSGSSISNTVLIILLNLKSQLRTLSGLQ